MRTPPAGGGLLPAGTVSKATRAIFHQSPLWIFCPIEDINFGTTTSIRYATYSSFWKMKVVETTSRKTLVFDPGGCTSQSTCLPVAGRVARVALWGGVRLDAAMVSEAGAFLVGSRLVHHFPKRRPSDSLRRTYCGCRCLPETRLVRGSSQSFTARSYGSCGDKRTSRNAVERGV